MAENEKRISGKLSLRGSAHAAGLTGTEATATEFAPAPANQDRPLSRTADINSNTDFRNPVPDVSTEYTIYLTSMRLALRHSDHKNFGEARAIMDANLERLRREMKHQLTTYAKILSKEGDFKTAAQMLEQALDIDENDSRTWMAYGHILKREGRYSDAIVKFEKSLDIDPNDKYTHFDMGLTYLLMGDAEKAAVCFNEVLCIDSSDYKAKEELAKLRDQGIFPKP